MLGWFLVPEELVKMKKLALCKGFSKLKARIHITTQDIYKNFNLSAHFSLIRYVFKF